MAEAVAAPEKQEFLFKVIVIGEPSVGMTPGECWRPLFFSLTSLWPGKTSTIKRYVEDVFSNRWVVEGAERRRRWQVALLTRGPFEKLGGRERMSRNTRMAVDGFGCRWCC